MKKIIFKAFVLFLLFGAVALLTSCNDEKSTLSLVRDTAEHFPFRYGTIYSDEFAKDDAFYLSSEMKKKILGDNAEKYTYIVSVSVYLARDMVSGSEVIAIKLDDRSHRAEITSLLYRRAEMKLDTVSRVFCEGDCVFFVCDIRANEIIQYIKSKI